MIHNSIPFMQWQIKNKLALTNRLLIIFHSINISFFMIILKSHLVYLIKTLENLSKTLNWIQELCITHYPIDKVNRFFVLGKTFHIQCLRFWKRKWITSCTYLYVRLCTLDSFKQLMTFLKQNRALTHNRVCSNFGRRLFLLMKNTELLVFKVACSENLF